MDRNKYSSYISAPKYMMGGPSMDAASLAQLLQQQIAGNSPAVGGIGAAGGMGTAESALSGPAGMFMSLPMKYLSGMHNSAQDAINAFTGMPSPIRKDPMRQIGAFLDQFTNKPTLSPGAIGTQNNITGIGSGGPIGTVGAVQALGAGNPAAQATLMGAMFPGAGSEPFGHAEPDEDQAGGPSDKDADNVYRFSGDEMPIELTRDDRDYSNDPDALAISGGRIAGLDRRSRSNDFSREPESYKIGSGLGTVASGFSKALGGLKGPDTGMLAGALKSAAANYPTGSATGRVSSGAFVGGPVSPPSMGGSPSAASMMGQRQQPQPRLMGQDYQLGDYTLPQRRRTTGYGGTGGGF